MITPLPPGLSPQAQAVLATAPPDRLPFAVNRVTARVMRAVFARRRQPDLDAAYTRWPAPTVPGRVAGHPVTELRPPALTGETTDRIVYVHGGGFVVGAPVDPLVVGLTATTGLPCTSVHYPLAPLARYPLALDRVDEVWTELTRGSSGRFVLVGTSAGGNLVLGLLQRLLARGEDAVLPTGVVLFTPAADMHEPGPGELVNEGVDPMIRWAGMTDISLAAYIGDVDRDNPEISPVLGDYRGLTAPTLLVTGSTDLLHGVVHRLADVLREQGVPVEVDDAPGMWHAYQQWVEIPEARASIERVAAFVGRVLEKG